MKMKTLAIAVLAALFITLSASCSQKDQVNKSYSGIYPHLAYYNNEGECGTGAVVPWMDRLYVITYGPHLPNGSSDKLYEIDNDLNLIQKEESIGGTPANRMIHKESNQLFIGPYAIDAKRNVRVIPYSKMPGRHTGNARDPKDPENKIICATMEEGFYRVDVNSLDVETLYTDRNGSHSRKDLVNPLYANLPGAHGKGVYSGQGVMVFSNNGEPGGDALKFMDIESGVLAEWDGKDWKTVRRNQFVEVTGPGGIYGNANPDSDPIWATGWDHRSVIVGTRDNGAWSFYRLPKSSHSYDGAHGWNTEWPRIRDIGTDGNPDYLMTMHGMFWKFPQTFTSKSSAGIRPRSAYLKVIGDYTRWNDKIVFGCDDSAEKEFLNARKAKGNIGGAGQSNSNLWFVEDDMIDSFGPTDATGAVWLNEQVEKGVASEPMLFCGWSNRTSWLDNSSNNSVDFTFEVDENGNGEWKTLETVKLTPNSSQKVSFSGSQKGEWIRVVANNSGVFSAQFIYKNEEKRARKQDAIFDCLTKIDSKVTTGGLLYSLGLNKRTLGLVSYEFDGTTPSEIGYYEMGADMKLIKTKNDRIHTHINNKINTPKNVISVDGSSILIVDDSDRRWRLPLSPKYKSEFAELINEGVVRICREVATERDLFNAGGTFYELPAENADGYAKIRPISSHNLRVHDYASYRGLLLLTGIDPSIATKNNHIIVSEDKKAAVWAGGIDDLWKLGKPVGVGGPWTDSDVIKGIASDPYLIGFYDKKNLTLSHNSKENVSFLMEVSVAGNGKWLAYKTIEVKPSESFNFKFTDSFDARWVRFTGNKDCKATALLEYK